MNWLLILCGLVVLSIGAFLLVLYNEVITLGYLSIRNFVLINAILAFVAGAVIIGCGW